MSDKVMITESTLDDIADAIREKNGEEFKYYPNEMPAAVRRIQTGGGGSGSVVAVFPVLLSGEHIADIVVDGDRVALYAPEPIEYTAGTGIEISSSGVVSVSDALRATIAGKVDSSSFDTAIASLVASVASKQDLLIAGDGITITGNTISADGTDVEANPTGTPTDELNTIRIGSDIYEIVGGGQSGDVETLFTSSSFVSTINLTKDLFDYDLITLEVSDGNGYTRGISFAPSELSLNQIIGFDNTYGYIWNSITSGTVLTNVSQYNFFVASIVGMKMGAGGSGGASAVSDLTDVDLNNLSNGQVLKYNSTTQKWENANESGGSSLPFDVVINSTDNGIDIVYDDGT